MDQQLYLDNIVYPTLDLLLQNCKSGKMTKREASKIAKNICNMKSCSLERELAMCSVMGEDALECFKERLSSL